MNIYYYVHTGHRFGLDRFRKAVSIINSLPELEITLLTSDYRIASSSKEFGVKRAIGIDVLRNIPNVANHGDILIYDSDEHNEDQLKDMIYFFSKFIRVGTLMNDSIRDGEYLINPYIQNSENSINANPINELFFGEFEKKIEQLQFFGDDDYDKDLLKYSSKFENLNSDLLLGFYYFLGCEDEFQPYFKTIHETEDYDEVVQSTKSLITSSYQTALESLVSGGEPIYIEREDRDDSVNQMLENYGIPVIKSFNSKDILETLNSKKSYKVLKNRNSEIREFLLKIIG